MIVLNLNGVRVCSRAREGILSDPKAVSHSVKGWFFEEGSERRFHVTDETLEYCLDLIRQAYQALGGTLSSAPPQHEDP